MNDKRGELEGSRWKRDLLLLWGSTQLALV